MVITSYLVNSLPNVTKTDGRVESVKNRERCCDVSNYGPGPEAIEVHLDRVRVCPPGLQCVDRPHREIANQEKGYTLTAWLLPALLSSVAVAFGGI